MAATSAIILAAGKSTRMKSDLPKVLHDVCGRPMLGWVVAACRLAGVEKMFVVVGHGKSAVMDRFSDAKDITWVEQKEQKGTGHAVLCCREAAAGWKGSMLVIAGDMPLVRRETLAHVLQAREQGNASLVLATTILDDPTGYGRIVRDENGDLEAIVEERDGTPAQRQIREVNPSYYCFDAARMFDVLLRVRPDPNKGEYYITDAVRLLREEGDTVLAVPGVPPEDATGINARVDLATVNRLMQDRIQFEVMSEGVTIVDPDNTWIEADVTIGRDTVVYPFTALGAGAMIGSGCVLGPFAHVARGDVVADGTTVCGLASGGVLAR